MRVLIIGCGYVGHLLGEKLADKGHEVFGVRRPVRPRPQPSAPQKELTEREKEPWRQAVAELATQRCVRPLFADITCAADLQEISGSFDWVVNTVSSTKGGVDEYRAVYLEGSRNLLNWLAARPPEKYIHVSSTSVYGQTDGSWVTEESLTEPTSKTSRVLVETEQLLLAAAREKDFPVSILRVAGIYGPERGHLFQQYLNGEARLSGEGARFINMIHRDDVVAAILAAFSLGRTGEIYNVADDFPVTQRDFFEWLSSQLGGPMPPRSDADDGSKRKRGLTNKRVANGKLRQELRCELNHPTFRQGYTAEIARLRATGRLGTPEGKN